MVKSNHDQSLVAACTEYGVTVFVFLGRASRSISAAPLHVHPYLTLCVCIVHVAVRAGTCTIHNTQYNTQYYTSSPYKETFVYFKAISLENFIFHYLFFIDFFPDSLCKHLFFFE